ncbi:MAG: HD-GYP domain-containing protein, partial [Chitinivibrionales bacterium]
TRGHQKILEELVEKRTQELKKKNRFLSNAMLNTIVVLTQTIEAKDPYTRGHCLRVSNFCVEIAKVYGLSKKSLKNLRIGSILHDIGKIGIPGNILNKPGRLDDEEFEIIKKHPVIGANILKNVEYYNPVIPILRHHHERYDGKGYPDNITNSDMPPEIAAITVADTYDAITSSRPYRKAIPEEKALSILNEVKGTQLHPDMVDIFIENKLYKTEHKNLMQIDFSF